MIVGELAIIENRKNRAEIADSGVETDSGGDLGCTTMGPSHQ
jgi:hypothetical protein